ncbi:c-di-AMP phosphodiesterase-like protein [Scopulibacillus daqui]|uniref:C-di-AMP phosphodiesterase-like protein n=1 Tax=Scopulibacillus daqui TaxID=1469162 RepID=A0ABS2PWK3_9BACL|nr:hypothetical protein [Scopulibacillus daqui]MBM7644443.1 c-di-AMP phosphodiesterase-like protein [Scopulibacillus daqui]
MADSRKRWFYAVVILLILKVFDIIYSIFANSKISWLDILTLIILVLSLLPWERFMKNKNDEKTI